MFEELISKVIEEKERVESNASVDGKLKKLSNFQEIGSLFRTVHELYGKIPNAQRGQHTEELSKRLEGILKFEGYIFDFDFHLESSHILGDLEFKSCQFKKLILKNNHVYGDFRLSSCQLEEVHVTQKNEFYKNVFFTNCSCLDHFDFSHNVVIKTFTLSGSGNYSNNRAEREEEQAELIPTAELNNNTFKDSVSINNIVFLNGLILSNSTFGKPSTISNVSVLTEEIPCTFAGCTFESEAVFSNVKVRARDNGDRFEKNSLDFGFQHISFYRSRFVSDVTFKDCKLLHANFDSVTFDKEAHWIDCVFNGIANFNNAEFHSTTRFESTFTKSPRFHNTKIHSDTYFPPRSNFQDVSGFEAAKNYRRLKKICSELESDYESMAFHALELKSNRSFRKTGGHEDRWESIFSVLYEIVNDYGLNLVRPLVLILLAFFILFVLSTGTSILTQHSPVKLASNVDDAYWLNNTFIHSPHWHTLTLQFFGSMRAALGPFGLVLPKVIYTTWYLELLNFSVTILSSLMWFFFIFGIRRRFKIS